MLTEIEKWECVNRTSTFEELKQAMLLVADVEGNIQGRYNVFPAQKMYEGVDKILHGDEALNYLTRNYGIRSQFVYLTAIL